MTDESLILRSDAGGVCTLTLNRPDKGNAVNRELFRAFKAHIKDIEANGVEIGVVVIKGSGGHFCAGHDLKSDPHPDAFGWLRQEIADARTSDKAPPAGNRSGARLLLYRWS